MSKPKMQVSVNIGFITNSSSVIHHFPKELLENPKVAAFLKAFELGEGYVGEDLWHRGECATIAITKAQKQATQTKLNAIDPEYGTPPSINVESDDVVIIYGDEYTSPASHLASLLCEAQTGDSYPFGGRQYN